MKPIPKKCNQNLHELNESNVVKVISGRGYRWGCVQCQEKYGKFPRAKRALTDRDPKKMTQNDSRGKVELRS